MSIARLHALIEFAKTKNPTYDNTSTIYWCSLEANLFIIVACMPAAHAVLQKGCSIIIGRGGTSGYQSSHRNSYFDDPENRQRSGSSLPFGKISKRMDIEIYGSDRSESDVEPVDC